MDGFPGSAEPLVGAIVGPAHKQPRAKKWQWGDSDNSEIMVMGYQVREEADPGLLHKALQLTWPWASRWVEESREQAGGSVL